MAYLNFQDPIPAAGPITRPVADAIAARFDRHEWEVIVLARWDGLSSLREPSRLARGIAWLFGTRATRHLANPRLEALRRTAVLAWHYGYRLPISALKSMKEAGFSPDQAELMLASVSESRNRPRRVLR